MEPPGDSGVRDSAARDPRRGGTAGRHRPRKWFLAPAVHRQYVSVGGAAVIVALASGVVLTLQNPPATVPASKCRPGGCHQVVPLVPRTVVPSLVPATATALPPASPSTRAPSAAPSVTVTATAAPSVTATPSSSPTASTPGLTPGSRISIQATTPCCTSFYIRHDDNDNRVVITQLTPGSSGTAKADATWVVQAGLAKSSCVSLEAANDPGQYLRHYDFELYLDPDDGSTQFAQDATFCPRPGNSGQGYSFQSVNYPDKYIRHYDYVVYLASDGGASPWDTPALWPDDTTWLAAKPWA
jgi:Alpha-L-arabinofuranosidase B (ABFB) domain